MISDFIKGKKQFDFPEDIRKGILLHRQIDTFTDDHPVTKDAKKVFSKHYRLYSGPFTDVVYDHFLANDKTIFTEPSLTAFASRTYDTLDSYFDVLPPSFRQVLPYMKRHNWLLGYRSYTGIENSFAGIAHRARFITESQTAFALFKENYQTLQQCYDEFFPLLKEFCLDTLRSIKKR